MESSKRNIEVDIIKGICIISVVFTHVGQPILWFGFFMVYGFYFVAGYTFKDKTFLEFAVDKVRRIYISFVAANILALFILKLLSTLCEYYNIDNIDVKTNIKNLLAFNITNGFMSPSWFLFPLFLILFIFFVLNRAVKKSWVVAVCTFVVFFLTHLFYEQLSVFQWCNCAFITNVGSGLFIFSCGYILKNNKHIEDKLFYGKYANDIFVVCTIIMFKISNKIGLDLRAGYCSNALYLMVVIFVGLYWLIYISKFFSKSNVISKLLSVVGQYSMSIMFFHILSFSVVTLSVHYLFKLPYPKNWAVVYNDGIYGTLTGVMGIIVPMMVAIIYNRIKFAIKQSNWGIKALF